MYHIFFIHSSVNELDFATPCGMQCAACGILIPQSGIEPTPCAVEARNLNPGPLGKSLNYLFQKFLLTK